MLNYYNYFTEVEEHFRRARNSGMFMMSPLDWALVETWKDAGIPIDAVLKGIDRSFATFRTAGRRRSTVNSVAYCTQEVMGAASQAARARVMAEQRPRPGFEESRLEDFFKDHAGQLRALAAESGLGSEVFGQAAGALEEMAVKVRAGELGDLEDVERRLTVLEDRLAAVAAGVLSEGEMLSARRELDAMLRPHRRKMKAEQIAMLEQRFLRKRSLEALGLGRLSLFYID